MLLLLLNIGIACAQNAEFLIQTTSLPQDLNFMPSLANGHLGFTVYGNAIFMNGIYNGRGGESRRARLPNWLNVSVASVSRRLTGSNYSEDGFINFLNGTDTAPLYDLNLKDGYFRWRQSLASVDDGLELEQRIYAHRYYNRALIYELFVRRTTATTSLVLDLTQSAGNASEAFEFTPIRTDQSFKAVQGVTKVVEHAQFQPERKKVFIVFSEDFPTSAKKTLTMDAGEKELYYRYIITADEDEAVARREMNDVLLLPRHKTLQKHATEWHKFWQGFSIEIEDNLELSQTVNAGIFYLACSLPSLHTNQLNHAYFGLGPTGLGRGQLDADYEGHNFWDTEIWMLPAIEQLTTAWAEQLLQYRFEHLSGALYNAQRTGYKGARFPWESAYTGTEATNPCCPEVAAQEVHISPDIVFAVRQHFATTGDRDWLCRVGWPLADGVAAFLESRVDWNAQAQRFHIQNVMGPDEDHSNVSDNVYTNVVFKLALEFASSTQHICAPEEPSNQNWLRIANNLFILYDADWDYHPQHVGYRRGEQVKQADVVLLGYPLLFRTNASTRLHDLQHYEQVTRPSGPAMTWSIFAINFLDVAQVPKAEMYFEKGYKNYVRPEFKVWSEVPQGYEGSANFLTGVGGFLQAIINGYGGIRFRHDNQKSIMEIRKTHLLPGSTRVRIKGIKFANAVFDLIIETKAAVLICLELDKQALELVKGAKKYEIFKGFTMALHAEKVNIQTV